VFLAPFLYFKILARIFSRELSAGSVPESSRHMSSKAWVSGDSGDKDPYMKRRGMLEKRDSHIALGAPRSTNLFSGFFFGLLFFSSAMVLFRQHRSKHFFIEGEKGGQMGHA
jgi:hypothetical protein